MNQKDFSVHENVPECQNAQYNRIILHRNIGMADESDEPMVQYNIKNDNNN